jgi:predicted methyltransferase
MSNSLRQLATVLVALCCACSSAVAPDRGAEEPSVRPGVNDRFLADDLDVERFVNIFEGESREISVRRREIAASLGLAPGMSVADVGAGTGLFLDLFAAAVGPTGRVHAIEISPVFVQHLEARARDRRLDQVSVVQCTDRSIELAAGSADVAFVCDTYHHFEYPVAVLSSIRRALRPGGQLVVVDFVRVRGVSRDWILDHVRADQATVRAEIEAAGFEFLEEVVIEGLVENYVLRFRRP